MNSHNPKSPAEEILSNYIEKNRLRHTPERLAILEKVNSLTRHFTIETLLTALESDGYHVSRATAYNTIALFVNAGIVRKHQFGNQPAQYEKIVDTARGNHQHLVCTRCGKVKEFNDSSLSTLSSLISERHYQGFAPEYFAVYLYGICSACRRKKNNKPQVKLA